MVGEFFVVFKSENGAYLPPMKFFPTTSEGWSTLVLTLTTILGVILAFANLKKSRSKGKKHRIKKFLKRITIWGWVTLCLSFLIGYGTYRSQELASVELNTEKTRIENRAFNDSLQQFEGFESNTKDLRKTIGILEKQVDVNSGRFDTTLNSFGQQLGEIVRTQKSIQDLQHPLFPVSIEYELSIDISDIHQSVLTSLEKSIERIKHVKDTLSSVDINSKFPRSFYMKYKKERLEYVDLKDFDPESWGQFSRPFSDMFGQIVHQLFPDVIIYFVSDASVKDLVRETADFVLIGNDLGSFRGNTRISFRYNGTNKILAKVIIDDASFYYYNGYFTSIEALRNGFLAIYLDSRPNPKGIRTKLEKLVIFTGPSKTDSFKLNFTQTDIKQMKVYGEPSEVYLKSGTEVLSNRNNLFY